jgi:hypothetical protein
MRNVRADPRLATKHQRRLQAGETLMDLAKKYNVSHDCGRIYKE